MENYTIEQAISESKSSVNNYKLKLDFIKSQKDLLSDDENSKHQKQFLDYKIKMYQDFIDHHLKRIEWFEELQNLKEPTRIIRGGYDDFFNICEKCEAKLSSYSIKLNYDFCPKCGRPILKN